MGKRAPAPWIYTAEHHNRIRNFNNFLIAGPPAASNACQRLSVRRPSVVRGRLSVMWSYLEN